MSTSKVTFKSYIPDPSLSPESHEECSICLAPLIGRLVGHDALPRIAAPTTTETAPATTGKVAEIAKHLFHKECFKTSFCPLCRADVANPDFLKDPEESRPAEPRPTAPDAAPARPPEATDSALDREDAEALRPVEPRAAAPARPPEATGSALCRADKDPEELLAVASRPAAPLLPREEADDLDTDSDDEDFVVGRLAMREAAVEPRREIGVMDLTIGLAGLVADAAREGLEIFKASLDQDTLLGKLAAPFYWTAGAIAFTVISRRFF